MSEARVHFVTGTDTGIGKTLVSCALVHALRARGVAAVGMKPVASGAEQVDGRWVNEDAEALARASGLAAPTSRTNPYLFAAPLAPHVAAAREGRSIDRGVIVDALTGLRRTARHVIVEGVGGFVVPLGDDWTTADLARDMGASVILVVGLRLGCINHALLSAEAIRARGLELAGWVANCQPEGMLEQDATIDALKVRLMAPILGIIPRLSGADYVSASEALDIRPLLASNAVNLS
nr:dethiobiotin synthase [Methyloversatilis thermotolerans]